jgi:DNA-binding transcriptional MerR regulator
MGQYSIRDLEKLTGIKAHTIRIWEKRYGIVQPNRTDTNIRTYSDQDLRRLLNIAILNHHGIKISRLAGLSDAEIEEKVMFVSQDPTDTSVQIESLLMAMIQLDEKRFHEILNKVIMVSGFEEAFRNVVMRALDRVGVLWQTGTINPAQEHFISNLVRQKLVSSIDALHPAENRNRKRFILFLPEGELHELGLLFSAFLIKKRGHEMLYFGQFTPLNSVVEAETVWPADILLISIVTSMTDMDPETLADQVAAAFPDKTILFTGRESKNIPVQKHSNIRILSGLTEFTEYLDGLADNV